MKTVRNLWPHVVSWDNLLAAYRKCRRRKRLKPDAAVFDFQWESNLLGLQRELCEGTYEPGGYRHFYIREPKLRKISAAPFRDRVVHHAVVRVLEPIFEQRFVFDSYACRRGKGTHRAVLRACRFLRRYGYYLKTDIVRFYPNVDHAVPLEVLGRVVRDYRLMELIGKIVASGREVLAEEATPTFFSGDDLFALTRPRGLPIGNLTSQFFANVLLDQVDHLVKEELRVPGYVRYADDMVLFADDKSRLRSIRQALKERLYTLRLRLHRDKTMVSPTRRGLGFLGFVLHRDGRRLKQETVARFNRRIRRLRYLRNRGAVSTNHIHDSLQAWLAHSRWGNSEGIRRELWTRVWF